MEKHEPGCVCARVLVSVGCGRAGEALFGSALWKFPGSCSVCFPFVFICGGLFSLWRFVTGTNSRGKVAASVVVVARHSPHPHPPSSSRSPIPPPQQPTRFVTAPPDRQRQHVVCLTGSTTAAAGLWVLAPPPPLPSLLPVTSANCWPASWRPRPHKEIAAWPSLRDRPPNQASPAIGDSSRRAILKINVPGACLLPSQRPSLRFSPS